MQRFINDENRYEHIPVKEQSSEYSSSEYTQDESQIKRRTTEQLDKPYKSSSPGNHEPFHVVKRVLGVGLLGKVSSVNIPSHVVPRSPAVRDSRHHCIVFLPGRFAALECSLFVLSFETTLDRDAIALAYSALKVLFLERYLQRRALMLNHRRPSRRSERT